MYCPTINKPVRTTAPTFVQEPLSLSEARRQCGLSDDNTYHDNLLARLITAAREAVENDTGLVCYTGEFKIKLTDWPAQDIELPVRPVTAVTSITYIDSGGTTTTWSAADYVLDTFTVIPAIRLAYTASWPATRGDVNGIIITFTAGYASVAAIPQGLKWLVQLKLHANFLDEQQEDSKRQHEGYERQLWQFQRSTYP